ncbi:MAG: methyltransferase domain-containing protein [Candidatus Woesearchaeota archaeon]|jgi:ubiquinone/menaquinone biosynthesis C-methylase UbiE
MFSTLNYWKKLYLLSRKRFHSKKDYEKFQEFQAKELILLLNKNGVEIKDKKVLDVGCYYGGFSKLLADEGGIVSGIDYDSEKIDVASREIKNVMFKVASVTDIPFPDQEFDVIIASSLIEHVSDQTTAIKEMYRVLKPGGTLYLSFPPFYSLNGGHVYKPFHLLPEKIAIKAGKIFIPLIYPKGKKYDFPNLNIKSFAEAGLYPTTISKMKKSLKSAGFNGLKLYSRFGRLHFLCKIPLLREVMVLHVEIIAKKAL